MSNAINCIQFEQSIEHYINQLQQRVRDHSTGIQMPIVNSLNAAMVNNDTIGSIFVKKHENHETLYIYSVAAITLHLW